VGEGDRVTLTVIQLANAAIMLVMVILGHLVLARHRAGRLWRAVADDPFAAELLGVDARRAFVLSYVASAFYASLSGVLATSYYGTMDFGAGLLFGLKVVLIAAAGGHSHPLRAAIGAAVVGFAETLWSGYGPILWRDFAIVSGLVAVLVISRRERAVP
jgi:branched-chain amino acid transport system permease protein